MVTFTIRLKCKKFGVAKVKISYFRTLLYKWGGVDLENLTLKRFGIQILTLKGKRWENTKTD